MNDICFRINNIDLFVDEELVEFDIPLFFTCSDNYSQKYAVLCIDSTELIYVVCKAELTNLIDVLTSKITMYDFFMQCHEKWKIYSSDDYTEDTVEQISNLKDDELPVRGTYFELSNKKISDYIERLQRELDSTIWAIIDSKIGIHYNLKQGRANIHLHDTFCLKENEYVHGIEKATFSSLFFSHDKIISSFDHVNSTTAFPRTFNQICFNNEVSCYV